MKPEFAFVGGGYGPDFARRSPRPANGCPHPPAPRPSDVRRHAPPKLRMWDLRRAWQKQQGNRHPRKRSNWRTSTATRIKTTPSGTMCSWEKATLPANLDFELNCSVTDARCEGRPDCRAQALATDDADLAPGFRADYFIDSSGDSILRRGPRRRSAGAAGKARHEFD